MKNLVDNLITLADTYPFGFVVIRNINDQGEIIAANSQLCHLCGYHTLDEFYTLTNKRLSDLVALGDYHVFCEQLLDHKTHIFCRMITRLGSLINTEDNVVALHDEKYGEVYVLYVSLTDETENRNIFDQLTGLHERTYLVKYFNEQRRYNPERMGSLHWTIICFNILGFKAFNDAYGYHEGDQVLKRFTSLLCAQFSQSLVTRAYADRFIVFCYDDHYLEKVEKIHEQAKTISGDVALWVEAGIYEWKDAADLSSEINKAIDNSLAAAETIHGSRKEYYAVFTPDIADEVEKKLYIQAHIDEAIANEWIEIYLQPVVRTLTGKVCSFEALSRWNDPVYGMISPGIFIPALEEKNLSYKLARYVIDHVGQMISRYEENMHRESVPISLNLSRRDFDLCNPFKEVEQAVKKYHIKRRQICIEITESTAMESPELIRRIISKFHNVQYSVWMDDFGSSYSSLNALKDFDFDEIKLDMVFMQHLNEKGKIIVKNCITMAKELGIHTLCEGVETKEQVEFLKNSGCEKIQGFYYSKPLPPLELLKTMKEKNVIFEGESEQLLYDSISNLKFDQDHSWFLTLVHDDEIDIKYVNEDLAHEVNRREVGHFLKPGRMDDNYSNISLKIADTIRQADRSGEIENISYFFDGIYYVVEAEKIAENNGYSLCKVTIRDTTRESREMILSDVDPVVQSILGMYDSIYLIDYNALTMEIMTSFFRREMIGSVTHFNPEKAAVYLSDEDREEFTQWISDKRVHRYFSDAHHSYDHHIFHIRMKNEKGTFSIYEKEFIILKVGKTEERKVLICIGNVIK